MSSFSLDVHFMYMNSLAYIINNHQEDDVYWKVILRNEKYDTLINFMEIFHLFIKFILFKEIKFIKKKKSFTCAGFLCLMWNKYHL
jgi:hypothetical protein